jgi:MFS family permease
MIDTTLFRNSWFSVNLITGFMTFVASAGTVLLLPFFLQDVMGLSPRTTGLLMAVNPAAIGVLGTISGVLSDRIGSRKLTTLGLFFLILGYWLISGITQDTPLFEFVLRALPMGIGMGVFQSPNNSAVMGAAPRERLGVVSGMLSISRTLGQMVGISILSAVWALRTAQNLGAGLLQPFQAEALGFQQTTRMLVLWIIAAFLISLWTLFQERKLQTQATREAV